MPTLIQLNNGRQATILEPRDILELVDEYMGGEVTAIVENLFSQIEELNEEIADLEKQLTNYEPEKESWNVSE